MPFKGMPFYSIKRATTQQSTTVVTSGLQLYFDAGLSTSYPGTGTTWNDISGNGKTATITGNFAHVSGTAGYLWDFYNFNTYITINSTTITGLSALTVQSIFMYEASQYEGAKHFASTNSGGNGWALETRFGGNEVYFISDGGSRNAGTTVTQNIWNFASGIRDVSNLSVSLRTNGNSRITNTYPSMSNVDLTAPWMVSRFQTGGVILRGRLAAILFYNRALTTTEETQNYNYFKTRYTSMP